MGMGDNERDEKGKFVKKLSKDDIVEYLKEHGEATTNEIADGSDMSYASAYNYLRELEDSDEVCRRKRAGANFWDLVGSTEA